MYPLRIHLHSAATILGGLIVILGTERHSGGVTEGEELKIKAESCS